MAVMNNFQGLKENEPKNKKTTVKSKVHIDYCKFDQTIVFNFVKINRKSVYLIR